MTAEWSEWIDEHFPALLLRERESAKEVERLREALEKIQRTPFMPFPDPGAHSWEAFARRVYGAWADIQRTARIALAAENGEQT